MTEGRRALNLLVVVTLALGALFSWAAIKANHRIGELESRIAKNEEIIDRLHWVTATEHEQIRERLDRLEAKRP